MMSLNLFLFKIKIVISMGFLRKGKKEEAPKSQSQPQKSVTYVMNNVGSGSSCDYAGKINELMGTSVIGKDGRSTTMSAIDASAKALEILGLPSGISYFAQGRKLFVTEEVKTQIESNPELNKKFRKALGIDEKQELKFEKYL